MPFVTPNPSHLSAQLAAHLPAQSGLPAFAFPDKLPADIDALKGLLQDQHQAYAAAIEGIVAQAVKLAVAEAVAAARLEAKAEMQRMIEQIILARHRQFGVSSEQLSAQARLFDEAETLAQSSTESDDVAAIPHPPAPGDRKSTRLNSSHRT